MHRPGGRIIESRIAHHHVRSDREHAGRDADRQDERDRHPPPQPSRRDPGPVTRRRWRSPPASVAAWFEHELVIDFMIARDHHTRITAR